MSYVPVQNIFVIPAKAGIHFDLAFKARWIPAFAGMTPKKWSAA